jgi:hypothetical protein
VRTSIVRITLSVLLLGLGLGLLARWGVAAPPQRGDIAGVVLAGGAPAAGATVQLFGGPGFIDHVAETVTNSAGEFRFRRIAVGSYSITASRFGQGQVCSGSAPVTVVNGQTTTVTVAMDCQSFPP